MQDLQNIAKDVRRRTFEMVMRAGRGHLGGSLSCVEVLVALYAGGSLRHDPQRPDWEERDRFILSKGHANNSLDVMLALSGYYDLSELDGFLADGTRLGMHVDRRLPGFETLSGSLGHGLGVAAGIAMAAKLDGKDYLTVVLMGDGESQEGSIWEAGIFAAQHKLDNLIAVTDRNRLGSEDFTENTAGLEPLGGRWESFGWEVKSIDGHSFPQIFAAFEGRRGRNSGRPLMILANTTKGKGVSSLENRPHAHHTLPKGPDVERAREELR